MPKKKKLTREKLKRTMLQILREKVNRRHYAFAKKLERDGMHWECPTLDEVPSVSHPLMSSNSLPAVRACTEGCILQKAYVRLESEIVLDQWVRPLIDLGAVFHGLLTTHQIDWIINFNDNGHFNKLKKYINERL